MRGAIRRRASDSAGRRGDPLLVLLKSLRRGAICAVPAVDTGARRSGSGRGR